MWEYKMYVIGEPGKKKMGTGVVEDILNNFGKKNWELVQFEAQHDGTFLCVFKRLRGIDGPTA